MMLISSTNTFDLAKSHIKLTNAAPKLVFPCLCSSLWDLEEYPRGTVYVGETKDCSDV